MAVNKNFVVKNGLEVNDNLIVADVDTQKVGIGTSVASYELHVSGGVGATMMYVCGVTTVTGLVSAEGALTVGGNTNITGITTLAGGGGGSGYDGGYITVVDTQRAGSTEDAKVILRVVT